MPDSTDVVVAGAGPAGSATALRLARLGFHVTLIDRAVFPREKVCAEYLSPATLREIESLPVSTPLDLTNGALIKSTQVISPNGSQVTGRFGPRSVATGRALTRRHLDQSLFNAAIGAGVVSMHAKAVSIDDTGSGMLTLRTEQIDGSHRSLRARVIVGADGLNSTVARRAGLHRQGPIRRIAFSAHMRQVAGMQCTTEMHVSRDGYVGLNALGDDLTNVSLVVPAHLARHASGDAEDFFWRQLRSFPVLRERLDQARIAREVMVTGPFNVSCRRSTAAGVLLVGDAAEFFDPFTGDGIHSALVGARLAAKSVHQALQQSGRIDAGRLYSYRRMRQQTFLGKWLLERMIGYAMFTPALFDRCIARLSERKLGDLLIGATGNEISPWRVLQPFFLARMII